MVEITPITTNAHVNPRPRKRLVASAASPRLEIVGGLAGTRNRKAGFKKSDVWRAISAAQKGGVTVSEMEIGKDGAIRLKFASGQPDKAISSGNDQFDKWEERL